MQASPEPALTPVPKQPLHWRLIWFVVGGIISVGINAGPYVYMCDTLHWPMQVSYAVSLTLATAIFAVWNYYINFRTDRSLRDCMPRYLGCVALCSAINYIVAVSGLKAMGHEWLGGIGRILIIATVQIGMGGIKFLLYHFWVYPHVSETQRTV